MEKQPNKRPVGIRKLLGLKRKRIANPTCEDYMKWWEPDEPKKIFQNRINFKFFALPDAKGLTLIKPLHYLAKLRSRGVCTLK